MGSDLSLQIIDKIIEKDIKQHIDASKLTFELIPEIKAISEILINTLENNKKILICGNGGSCCDAQHFSSELVGRFEKQRKSLAAISLSTDNSAITSIGNDYSFDKVFSRQIEGLGNSGDALFVISTSGKSRNILEAIKKAKEKKIHTIALLGRDGGDAKKNVDYSLTINSERTARIQEMHILIIHIICGLIEREYT